MRLFKIPSIALSLLIQLAPLLRIATADAALAVSPIMAVLRVFTGAVAVAGSFHAVSGATAPTLSSSKTKMGAIGVNLTYRILLSGGSPESYQATPIPAGLGLNLIRNGNGQVTGAEIKGLPTETGQTLSTITAWDDPGFEGDSTQGVVAFLIADIAPLTSSIPAGQTVTFNVLGTQNAPVTYRWLHDDVEVPAPQGTNSFLTLAEVGEGDAGQYRVRINFGNTSALTQRATLTVLPPVAAPIFTESPSNAVVHLGEPLILRSVATGEGDISFAWLRNGEPLPDRKMSTLEFASVTEADAGEYQVIASGPGGSNPSDRATVTVADPLSIGPVSLGDGELSITFNGIAGRAYVLESRPGLTPADWAVTGEPVGGEFGAFVVPNPESGTRVYRIRTR